MYIVIEKYTTEHTKGSPTPKSEPALLYLTHTTNIKNQFSKKVAGCGLRFTTNKPTNTDIHPHPTTIYPTSPDYSEKPVYSLGLRHQHLLPDKGFHILCKSWRTPFY